MLVATFVDAEETLLVLVNDGAVGLLGVELIITLLLGWSGCCCWLNTDDTVEFVDVWLVVVAVFELASLARTAVGFTTGCGNIVGYKKKIFVYKLNTYIFFNDFIYEPEN